MDINVLIAIVKKKISNEIVIENISIEDKSFLHKQHPGHKEGKYHLKVLIESKELKSLTRIEVSRHVHKILEDEIKKFIHSIQIKLL